MVSINPNLKLQQTLLASKNEANQEVVQEGTTLRTDADFPEPEVQKTAKPKPKTVEGASIFTIIRPNETDVLRAVRDGVIGLGGVFTNGNARYFRITEITYNSFHIANGVKWVETNVQGQAVSR